MKKQKSERHHWWPETVSEHWKNADGFTHWLRPDGTVIASPPKNFGVIGNGHFIKLSDDPSEGTPWDENFEREFERADSQFPRLIAWLKGLDRKTDVEAEAVADRFLAQRATDEDLSALTESLVSLAVRSPMNRAAASGLAEHFRGPLPSREKNAIAGLNMRRTQRVVSDAIGSRAKFCVLYSPEKELIFGDGLCTNIRSPGEHIMSPYLLAPLTPDMAVMIARPSRYSADPRLTTLVATAADAVAFNHAVQVHAKDAIFYRSEPPTIDPAFEAGEHMRYTHPGNPIETLIHLLPGVPARDTTFDDIAVLWEQD